MEETKTLETIIETIISRNILAIVRERNCRNKTMLDSASERCLLKERENKVTDNEEGKKKRKRKAFVSKKMRNRGRGRELV